MKPGLLILWCVLIAAPVRAEILDSTPAGFTVKTVAGVQAPAARVYQALTDRVGSWWDASHSYSGNAANLSIDARPGGCFCERLPTCGVQHMTVIYADPGKLLRMTGGLGPLQDLAVTGVMSWKLTESSGQTTIELTYKVAGYAPGGGVGAFAMPVDNVLSGQLKRLVQYVSTH
jgi:uncharacterized protein YndB with AHSA1/START domain